MNNDKVKKGSKMTTDKLALMVASGFDRIEKRLGDKIYTEVGKVKEDIKDVRKDILNLGDRFVSYHTFDGLANRVKVLEDRKK